MGSSWKSRAILSTSTGLMIGAVDICGGDGGGDKEGVEKLGSGEEPVSEGPHRSEVLGRGGSSGIGMASRSIGEG